MAARWPQNGLLYLGGLSGHTTCYLGFARHGISNLSIYSTPIQTEPVLLAEGRFFKSVPGGSPSIRKFGSRAGSGPFWLTESFTIEPIGAEADLLVRGRLETYYYVDADLRRSRSCIEAEAVLLFHFAEPISRR